jgi:hypothetical protein
VTTQERHFTLPEAQTEAERREHQLMVRNLKGARAQLLRVVAAADDFHMTELCHAVRLWLTGIDERLEEL